MCALYMGFRIMQDKIGRYVLLDLERNMVLCKSYHLSVVMESMEEEMAKNPEN